MTGTAPPSAATGASTYKTWVTTLRMWSKEPSTSLDGLPPLEDSAFGEQTYVRLADHLSSAISTMMDGWTNAFTSSWAHAVGTGDRLIIEKCLVDARRLLLPRLRLCSHRALPEEMRRTLMDAMRQDIEALQSQIEEVFTPSRDGKAVPDPTTNEEFLSIVRRNSFMRIFDEGYVDGSAILGLADNASAPGPVGIPATSGAGSHRAVSDGIPCPEVQGTRPGFLSRFGLGRKS